MTTAKSIEAEQAVLGAMCLLDLSSDSAQKVFSLLSASSFADPDNQIIFESIRRLASKNGSADVFTVDAECRKDKRYHEDLENYIIELTINTPSAANVLSYAEIVRDRAIERFAVTKLNEAIAVVSDTYGGDVYQRLGQAESLLSAIQERGFNGRSSGLVHIADIGKSWLPSVVERVEGGVQQGFTIGIEALDRLLYPKRIPSGSLVVVGARPKMGKTGLVAKILEHFSVDRKETAAMFSLEMPNDQIYERLLTGAAKVDPELFYRAAKGEDDWSCVTRAADKFNRSNLFIDDTPGVTIGHIKREVRKLNRTKPVKLIAVDYLTLMEADEAERNDLAYGKITKALKNLAKEINGVVVMLTQLNRNLESRPNKRPMPSDSRDTGQIEQDCDLWIGLYRDGAYNDDSTCKSLTEAIVRLNRHGNTGTAYFNLIDGTVREVDQDWARESSEQPKSNVRKLEF